MGSGREPCTVGGPRRLSTGSGSEGPSALLCVLGDVVLDDEVCARQMGNSCGGEELSRHCWDGGKAL